MKLDRIKSIIFIRVGECYMKNKTKGFTLIELLATIVILAIIALIATPNRIEFN